MRSPNSFFELGIAEVRKTHLANTCTALKRKRDRPASSPYYVGSIYPLRNLLSASHLMSESAFRVAKYITENPDRAASMSIGELAAATGSNKAAVVRVSKLSGYEGYRGLRAALIEHKGVMRAADLIDLSFSPHKSDPSQDTHLSVLSPTRLMRLRPNRPQARKLRPKIDQTQPVITITFRSG